MLDTNLCIRVLRDRAPSMRATFNAQADSLCISTIVLTELLHGAAKSARPEHNRREVEGFAARLETLSFDAVAADHAADIRAALERRQGLREVQVRQQLLTRDPDSLLTPLLHYFRPPEGRRAN